MDLRVVTTGRSINQPKAPRELLVDLVLLRVVTFVGTYPEADQDFDPVGRGMSACK